MRQQGSLLSLRLCMVKQNQFLITEAVQLTPANNLVESTPVEVSKKLSQNTVEEIPKNSHMSLHEMRRHFSVFYKNGRHTKSAKKGWRVVAKW